jgi:carboxymethylenebutenolidase
MTSISIAATDGSGHFAAYVATPTRQMGQKPRGAMVVIQEIFGVNASMRATADAIAAMGFSAIVPDLFWRQQPGVQLTDKTDADWQQAFKFMQAFDQAKGIEDLKAALATARTLDGCNGRVGTIGYCLGGRLAFMMAAQSDADLNISYYGVMLDGLLDQVGAIAKPLLVHIAAQDSYVPPETQGKILAGVAGNKNIAAYVYEGAQHAFARIDGIHFDALCATIANGRSAEAMARVLG